MTQVGRFVVAGFVIRLFGSQYSLYGSTKPTVVMSYTDIQTLRGLSTLVDYGSGVEYATGSVLLLPGRFRALQLGLWLNGTIGTRAIVSGALDSNIKILFEYLVMETPATVTYLRVGYEFDNPAFGYNSQESYKMAFRYMVKYCELSFYQCRSKVKFVWHSWAAGLSNGKLLADYYPGDDYVDWIGISVFSQVYQAYEKVGNMSTIADVLSFAVLHDKPTMIGESTPFGGIPNLRDPWNDWFEPVLELIEEYDVQMWCYIHCNWDAQPMWRDVGFGNTLLSVNETVQQSWNERVLQNPRFFRSDFKMTDTFGWSGMSVVGFVLTARWMWSNVRQRLAIDRGYRTIR